MKAKFGSRYLQQERTRLEDVIPLDTPFVLTFDPSSMCNQNCPFCPMGKHNRANWNEARNPCVASYEVFRKVIDDASNFPGRIKTLRLYKEGEPLLNKRLPDMISYAKKKNIADRIDFTTNGVLLNRDLNLALVDAGLTRINISLGGLSSEDWCVNTGITKMDFESYVKNIEHLYKNKSDLYVFVKIADVNLCKNNTQRFLDIFGDICDELSVEVVSAVWPEFDISHIRNEFDANIYGEKLNPIEVCTFCFYNPCVNADGTVSACSLDWNRELIVGDAKNESIVDIWNSDGFKQLWINQLSLQRGKHKSCANCGQLVHATLDNIDEYRERLLNIVKEEKNL